MAFRIQYEHLGGMNRRQLDVVREAIARLESVIKTDGEILVNVSASPIDGRQRILGQAAPTYIWRDSLLPAEGFLTLDAADMFELEQTGSLFQVVLHELLHVLGFGAGPLWERLLDGTVFTGEQATMNAQQVGHQGDVCLERSGGEGTAGAHWDETLFNDELMTGFLGPDSKLSVITIGALGDMGYEVDYSAADDYAVPRLQQPSKAETVSFRCRSCESSLGVLVRDEPALV